MADKSSRVKNLAGHQGSRMAEQDFGESRSGPADSTEAMARLAGEQRGGAAQQDPAKAIMEQVDSHMERLQKRSERVLEDEDGKIANRRSGKFSLEWRSRNRVPYRFRLEDPPAKEQGDKGDKAGRKPPTELPYTDYTGLRFPTLQTAENFDYHQDKGLERLVERFFPIKVPGYRRLDPYLREYIHFLHHLDPARFTVARIAERYRLREKTVATVVQEWAVSRWLTRSGMTRLRDKQTTKEAVILAKKEQEYKKWVGWDQLGDEDDPETDDEALGEYKGWRATSDWVRRQSVEVEMMSAFPMMEKRDPMPKRVDVDLVVSNERKHKIINWIDPTDKVVF